MREMLKKVDIDSWYPILGAAVIVWIMSCSRLCSEFIAGHRESFTGLVICCYLTLFFYVVVLKKKRDCKTLAGLIFLAGFLLRACYVLATPYNITKHDIGSFMGFDTDRSGTGHLGYIEFLYKNHRLLDFDPREQWGAYHPPGFYIVGAAVLQITRWFGVEEPLCYESLQVITLFFSTLAVWTGIRILREFSVSDRRMLFFTAFLSAHPFFSVMAATVTNDCMVMYLMLSAFWYTIRWQKSPDMKNILAIAFSLGLAMFTKLNAAVLAFGTGCVFVCVFWKRRGDYRKLSGQFLVFLVICASIGLFHPMRNRIKFDVPFTYIQSIDPEGSDFSPELTVLSRFWVPSFEQMSYAFPSFDRDMEWNVWIQLIRTSLFDELMPHHTEGSLFEPAARALLWTAVWLAVLTNAALFWCVCRRNTVDTEQKLMLSVGYMAMLFSYMKYCIDEPFFCTMNYRYIPVSMFFPLIGTAVWSGHKHGIVKKISMCSIAVFAVLAVIVDLYLIAWSNTAL